MILITFVFIHVIFIPALITSLFDLFMALILMLNVELPVFSMVMPLFTVEIECIVYILCVCDKESIFINLIVDLINYR